MVHILSLQESLYLTQDRLSKKAACAGLVSRRRAVTRKVVWGDAPQVVCACVRIDPSALLYPRRGIFFFSTSTPISTRLRTWLQLIPGFHVPSCRSTFSSPPIKRIIRCLFWHLVTIFSLVPANHSDKLIREISCPVLSRLPANSQLPNKAPTQEDFSPSDSL